MNTMEIIALSFSIGIAAVFWIVTQWNIIKTKNVLLKFQAEARSNASDLITAQFQRMEGMLDQKIKGINIPKLDEIDLLIGKRLDMLEIPEIPTFDMTPMVDELTNRVNGIMAAQGDNIKAQVLESSKMSFKAMTSGLTRGLHKELSGLEGPLDEFAEGLMNEAAASMDPQQMVMAQIMNMDVSDKFAKDNPLATLALRYGKMGLLKGMSEGGLGGGASTKEPNTQKGNTAPNSGIFG